MKQSPIKRKSRLKARSKKSSQVKALDLLCREIVLARDGHRCRKCGKEPGSGRGGALQAAHVFPKGQYPAVRWEIGNLITLCWRDHMHWWHKNPIEAREWIEAELGKAELERLRLIAVTRKRTDRKALQLYLQQLL